MDEAVGGRPSGVGDRGTASDSEPPHGWRNLLRRVERSGTFLRQAIQPSAADRVNRSLVSSQLRQVWHYEIACDAAMVKANSMPLAMLWIEHEYGAWHIEGAIDHL